MEIPEVIVEWGLGLASLVGVGGFAFLNNRNGKNADAITAQSEAFDAKISTQTNEFKEALKELGSQVIFIRNCDDRQDLWQSKFDAMMEANRLQHEQIMQTVTASNVIFDKQFEVLFEKMDDLDDCMRKLQQQRECA